MIPLGMSPIPTYGIKRLQQKRETITALVDALESFLAFDIDSELEQLEKMNAAGPPKSSVTPEMLVSAQTELAAMETQMESIMHMRDNFPEDLALMFDSLQSMLGNPMGGSLERQRETVKWMQNQLDGKTLSVLCCECHAALMADGSTNHGPLNPYEFFMGTREECEAKSRECGWVVNGEEHKCPECAAKS